MRKNILLTGRPGIGKSSVIQKCISLMGKERIGGFWSSEIREAGRRTGFSMETSAGRRGILAHINLHQGPRLGRYVVNVDDVELIAIPSLIAARNSGKIIIIDEIAAMELFAPSFESVVTSCLETGRVLGAIQQRSSPFLNSVRSRNDIRLLEVTLQDRDFLPSRIIEMIWHGTAI
ncbi:MAG: AAA family ATPase [Candidatus Thorarchaeota archaeon]|nr:AAA family ATPase [Candidatus Thorarchaeota archaeon]